ncbi:MAG: hypothetical protein PWQ50_772 [Methanolobus sp.]|jgi:hypothetical protein|nr:hypothetical protein [Methanolobus sp.]
MDCSNNLNSPLTKSKILYFVRNVLLYALLLAICLLALSWVSVSLLPYIKFMLNILGYKSITESELFDSSTNILLISITGVYVILTRAIVEENQKITKQNKIDRNIAHIEKKLEKFYNPLYRIISYELEIQLFIKGTYEHLTSDNIENIDSKRVPNIQVKQSDNYTILLQDLLYYSHLATDEIQEDLNHLVNLIKFKNTQPKMTLNDLKKLILNLENNVGFEIGHLRVELENLHQKS